MTRYKTISFDDFSDGEQCDAIEPTKKSFKLSENLVIKKNGVKLGKKLLGGVLYDSGLSFGGGHMDFLYSSSLYFLGSDDIDCFIKKCYLATGAWTTVVTLPDSGNSAFYFIKFRGLVIVNYRNDANAAYLVKYSTDGMTMTTFADTNLVTLSGISDFKIVDHKIIYSRLYILGSDEKIYYSDDGITFALLVALDSFSSVYSYYSLEYLSGYLYIQYQSADSVSGLVRVSLSGDVQDEVVSFGSFVHLSHRIFAGNSYILVDQKKLYRVDGANLVLVFEFENDVLFLYSSGFVNSLFLEDEKGIIEMNVDEKISRPFHILDSVAIIDSIHADNYVGLVGSIQRVEEGNASAAIYGVQYSFTYTASGNVQTRLVKAQGVPKQLVLRHNPLSANAWVKVYVKIDQASAWSSVVITSDVDGAVKATYDFPAGTELDFIEFKIEYGTDDSAETPENVTLDYIYLPAGLSNSK